ncbi:MAG: riboflavin synthase [Magnetococcales bacterium]|nr:riboflavin synthase [Magnetococcales bacterium]
MFTGLIETVGRIDALERSSSDWTLRIASDYDLSRVKIGDSIAVNGACLTVTAMSGTVFSVQMSAETVRRTTFANKTPGDPVNLEKALRYGDRLDGHLVQGHVDTVGHVEQMVPRGGSMEIWFRVTGEATRYIVAKGSVAIDGVSLTVNDVRDSGDDTRFSVNIIPHTQKKTALAVLRPGSTVNVETDVLGRYVERLLKVGKRCPAPEKSMNDQGRTGDDGGVKSGGIDEDFLRRKGFL